MDKETIKKADFSKEAEILKTIGHPLRLKIVVGLAKNECCVKDIWECMELPQPVVSQHLAILRNKGIVTANRCGNRTFYHLTDETTIRLVNALFEQ